MKVEIDKSICQIDNTKLALLVEKINVAIENGDTFSMQILGTQIELLGYKIIIDTKH